MKCEAKGHHIEMSLLGQRVKFEGFATTCFFEDDATKFVKTPFS